MHQERISFNVLLSLGSAWDNTRHQSRHGWQASSVLSIWQQQYGGLSILCVKVPRNRHICLSVWSERFFFQHPSCIHQATSVFLGCVRMVKWMWMFEPAVFVVCLVHFLTFYFAQVTFYAVEKRIFNADDGVWYLDRYVWWLNFKNRASYI